MNHFKTLFSFFFCLLLSFMVYATLDHSLSPDEISHLEKNVQTNQENLKSRLSLADHHSLKKNWSMVIKWLTPVVENLPIRAINQLIKAHIQLSHFQEAVDLIEAHLLTQKKIKTKTYLFAIKTYSDFLTNIPDKSIIVENQPPTPSETSPPPPSSKQKGNKRGKENRQKQQNQQVSSTRYKTKAEVVRKKIFDLLKQAQVKDPENVKIYDLWLKMLEKHITHYAFEARRVLEDMKINDVKLRKRHYSKLCKYNSLANLTVEAKQICQQAANMIPENPSNFIYLGQAHIDSGEREKGQRILASVGKKFSGSEEALWITANTHYENKKIASAYKYYLKASKHRKSKPRDFLGLAKTAFELKKYGISLKAFHEHCQRSHFLHQEFRRASGLLKKNPSGRNDFVKKCRTAGKKEKIKSQNETLRSQTISLMLWVF